MAQTSHFYFSLLNLVTLSEGDCRCFLFPPSMLYLFAKLSHEQVLLWDQGKIILIQILPSNIGESGSSIVGSG